jgi:glutaminase
MSAISGAIMLVIPNVMGISIWSPALDKLKNSVRGVEFCRELVKIYQFHRYIRKNVIVWKCLKKLVVD